MRNYDKEKWVSPRDLQTDFGVTNAEYCISTAMMGAKHKFNIKRMGGRYYISRADAEKFITSEHLLTDAASGWTRLSQIYGAANVRMTTAVRRLKKAQENGLLAQDAFVETRYSYLVRNTDKERALFLISKPLPRRHTVAVTPMYYPELTNLKRNQNLLESDWVSPYRLRTEYGVITSEAGIQSIIRKMVANKKCTNGSIGYIDGRSHPFCVNKKFVQWFLANAPELKHGPQKTRKIAHGADNYIRLKDFCKKYCFEYKSVYRRMFLYNPKLTYGWDFVISGGNILIPLAQESAVRAVIAKTGKVPEFNRELYSTTGEIMADYAVAMPESSLRAQISRVIEKGCVRGVLQYNKNLPESDIYSRIYVDKESLARYAAMMGWKLQQKKR